MLVGITGLKNVGKDTAADYLASLGFVKLAFGAAIYEELAINFNKDVEWLKRRDWKTIPVRQLSLSHCQDAEFVRHVIAKEMGTPPGCDGAMRPLCQEALYKPRTTTWLTQQWATEYRRALYGDDYWARIVVDQIKALPRGTHVVLSDLRHFPVEMAAFDAYRDINTHRVGELMTFPACGILELTRQGSVNTGHDSDRGLPRDLITKSYANDSTLRELYAAIDLFITQEIK